MLLCEHCDIYVGYGAMGVVRMPDQRLSDYTWLASHCWMCCRSADEIRADPRGWAHTATDPTCGGVGRHDRAC
jgi:hypothetical protein